MAAPIGALHAAMSAGHAQFAADMGKAKNAVRSSATGMQSAMEKTKKGFNGAIKAIKIMSVAGAAAGIVLGKMVNTAIKNADEITKMSQSVGVSVETLSAMAHAANLSGVSLETLAKALKITAQRSAETAAGTGEAKEAYKALGITVTDAEGALKNSDQLLLEVAERFESMENGAGKTALAIDLFGRSGADLIPMLNQGRAGLEEMTDEAARLGLVIDTETGQAAERFRDNLTRLKGVKVGLVNTITQAVLPTLEQYTDSMVESATETDSMAKAGETAATALKLLLTGGTLVKAVFVGVGEAIGGVAAVVMELVQGNFRNAMELAVDVADNASNEIGDTFTKIEDIWDTTAAAIEAKAPDTGKKLAAPLAVAVTEVDLEAAKLKRTVERYEAELASSAQRVFEGTRTPIEQFGATVTELDVLLAEGAISADTYARAVGGAMEKLGAMTEETPEKLKKTGEEFDSLGDNIKDWGKSSADAMLDFALAGKGSFKDMIDSMIQDLIRLIAKQLIVKALGGGPLGSIFGDGGVFSGGKVTPFARGGVVSSPTLFPMARGMGLMGEAGPEAVMPLKRTAGGQLGVQVVDGDKAGTPSSVTINVAGGTKVMTPLEQGMMSIKAIDDYLKETGDRLPSGRVINFQT